MSSSTKAIVTKNSTINNNDRKRPLSSSARLSTSPTSAKRRGYSSSSTSRQNSDEKIRFSDFGQDRSEKTIQIHDQLDFVNNSSSDFGNSISRIESNCFTATLPNVSLEKTDVQDDHSTKNGSKTVYEQKKSIHQAKRDGHSRENVSNKKTHSNFLLNTQKSIEPSVEPMYRKQNSSIAFLVKPASSVVHDQRTTNPNEESDDETETIRSNSTTISSKSNIGVSSTVMTIITTPDISKKSIRTDNNVIIQQIDGNANVASSTRLVKLVVPQTSNSVLPSTVTSPSIKMLSRGDGFTSALRVPTKIQLTKTSHTSSQHGDKSPSIISSVSNLSFRQEQTSLSPSSSVLIDIPIEIADKQQQSIIDYPTSAGLPPTPPPPVVDQLNAKNTNKFSRLLNPIHHQTDQEQEKQIRNPNSTKNIQDSDRSKLGKLSNHSPKIKQNPSINENSSSLSDWSVPPTSELSPTSITSSSPDVSHNTVPSDDPSIDSESTNIPKSSLNSETKKNRSLSYSFPLLSSLTMCCSESNDSNGKPFKSKSMTRLSNSSNNRVTSNNWEKTNNKTKKTKTVSSPRLRRRRGENESTFIHQQGSQISKPKNTLNQMKTDETSIIYDVLNQMIEQVVLNNETVENFNNVFIPVQKLNFSISMDRSTNKKTNNKARGDVIQSRTSAINRKRGSISQCSSARMHNESRSINLKSKDMDESAFLLYANEHRSEFERHDPPAVAEQRMRDKWSRMSNHDKRVFYTRVLEVYRRPCCETVITTTSTRDFDKSNISVPVTTAQLQRQTSTPLSFHSVNSSITDEQSSTSPHETISKPTVFSDIVQELIKGGNGLDKLSCTQTEFSKSIHQFVSSTLNQREEIVQKLEEEAKKTCAPQLQRATLFWSEKVKYFASKHSIAASDQLMNELTMIVKYYYLYVLSLMIQKQKDQQNNAFINLVNGKISFDDSFTSSSLTNVIQDLILPSTFGNDYLSSQPLVIGQLEYTLPFLRNTELEHELLYKTDNYPMNNPFSSLGDLEDYLSQCEHYTPVNIPYYSNQPVHHPSTYYQSYHTSPHYYYPSPSKSTDMSGYYYNPSTSYPHPTSHHPYNTGSPYYHHSSSSPYGSNEQFQSYYYTPQPTSTAYPSPSNNNINKMDIPTSHHIPQHRPHRPMNMDLAKQYSKAQSLHASLPTPSTPTVTAGFDGNVAMSSQSKPLNTIINQYPP